MHDDFYHKLQDSIKLDKTQPLEKYDVRNIVIGMERCLGHRKWKSSFQKEICMAEFLVWSLCHEWLSVIQGCTEIIHRILGECALFLGGDGSKLSHFQRDLLPING